jgi:PAS domain S-box-containing protein
VPPKDETHALLKLTDRLYRAQGLDAVFAAALDAITELLDCSRASILLFDDDGVMRFVAWRNLSDAYRSLVDGHTPWKPGDTDAEPIFVTDIRNTSEPDWLKQAIAREDIVGLGFVPLMANGVVVGKFMTYFPEPHGFSEHDRELSVAIARQVGFSLERHAAEKARSEAVQELRESGDRFRLMSEDAPIMIWISDSQGHCLHLNRMLRVFWGVSGEVGDFDFTTTIHPEDRAAVGTAMSEAMAEQRSVSLKGRYRRNDGAWRVLETTARPTFAGNGAFSGMIGVNVDITEREEADAHKQLLINELNHRVKNTLAVVQSVAWQTFRTPGLRDPRVSAFEGRLSALAQAHNLLAAEAWQSASLEEVARNSVNGDADVRIAIAGPRVDLQPKQAVTTAMALHELYTNAVKYGALRSSSGRVELSWLKTASPSLVVRWQEQSPDLITPPTRKGFGTTMIEQALSADLNAEVTMDFQPTGLICTIVAQLPEGHP